MGELEHLERIIQLEAKLTYTIQKLDTLIDDVKTKHETWNELYQGSDSTPSIPSRIISLESFVQTAKWTIGVLYTAVVAVIVKLLTEKL